MTSSIHVIWKNALIIQLRMVFKLWKQSYLGKVTNPATWPSTNHGLQSSGSAFESFNSLIHSSVPIYMVLRCLGHHCNECQTQKTENTPIIRNYEEILLHASSNLFFPRVLGRKGHLNLKFNSGLDHCPLNIFEILYKLRRMVPWVWICDDPFEEICSCYLS